MHLSQSEKIIFSITDNLKFFELRKRYVIGITKTSSIRTTKTLSYRYHDNIRTFTYRIPKTLSFRITKTLSYRYYENIKYSDYENIVLSVSR